MPSKKELITLDFIEYDTLAALEFIESMCRGDKVAGMIFAVSLKHSRAHPRLTGASGRLATNLVEASGIAAILALKLTQQAMEQSQS